MSALAAVACGPADRAADEDLDLVARVRAGDDRAFEQLFRRYQPRVTAYVRGMIRDHGRAEDVTQEVFMSALRRMRETDREIAFKPWIYEIAKNACIDAYRRGRHLTEVSFQAPGAIGAEEHGRLVEPTPTPDAAVEGKVALHNLRGAFGGLSPVHHDILVMRELEGLSYREIGERLGMTKPAVESTLFRARKRLTEEYEELMSGERCRRVERLVDAAGGRAPGMRDRRRMVRHLAHCQACRRYAWMAGVDVGGAGRTAAFAARIAAFVPLPAFLRRRWSVDEPGSLLAPGGSPVAQWSASAVASVDPGTAAGWGKAIATAASVAVAGLGAGAAFSHRVPSGVGVAHGSGGAAAVAPTAATPRGTAAGTFDAAGGATADASRAAAGRHPAYAGDGGHVVDPAASAGAAAGRAAVQAPAAPGPPATHGGTPVKSADGRGGPVVAVDQVLGDIDVAADAASAPAPREGAMLQRIGEQLSAGQSGTGAVGSATLDATPVTQVEATATAVVDTVSQTVSDTLTTTTGALGLAR